jgi:hypothetical protein
MQHRLDHVIDQLFKDDADRVVARAWAERLERDGVGERSEAIIREAARVADGTKTQEEALAYLADFSHAIGVPDYQIDRALQSLNGPTDHLRAILECFDLKRLTTMVGTRLSELLGRHNEGQTIAPTGSESGSAART